MHSNRLKSALLAALVAIATLAVAAPAEARTRWHHHYYHHHHHHHMAHGGGYG